MKTYSNILASSWHNIFEENKILAILASLRPKYDYVVVVTISWEDSYSLKTISSLLLAQGHRIEQN